MKMMCPHCGLEGNAKESLLGKKVRCPECQKVFRVDEKVTSFDDTEMDVAQQDKNNIARQEPASENEAGAEAALPEGVVRCSKCGFAFSAQFTEDSGEEILCALCSGKEE